MWHPNTLLGSSMFYRWQDGTLLINCHLQPKASRSEFAGQHGERLKVRIAAPPVDGKANKALVKFLAKQFGVPGTRVELVSGESSRQKTVAIIEPTQLPDSLGIEPATH